MLQLDMDMPLAKVTTLGLGGPCVSFIRFSADQAENLPDILAKTGGIPTPFGGGSNILAAGAERDKTLLCPVSTDQPELLEKTSDGKVFVKVDAGIRLGKLLIWAAKRGFSGLEGLSGIPGTLGGAIAGNAGSFGSNLGSCLHQINVFAPSIGLLKIEKSDFACSYRHFAIPVLKNVDWYIIINAILAFTSADPQIIHAKMRTNITQKVQTQPVTAKSAGCLFKNPQGDSAGRLLDSAGFRGKKLGGMAFSQIHANFLVNDGMGTAEQAMELIQIAKDKILQRYEIDLEAEVKIWDF